MYLFLGFSYLFHCLCCVGLPGVLWVLPDSYIDVKNKDYGGSEKTFAIHTLVGIQECSAFDHRIKFCLVLFQGISTSMER